jgi:hypothetical protein
MNEDFVEEFMKPFLLFAADDASLKVEKIYERRKKGRQKKQLENVSPYVRALIKQYVNFKKKQVLKKEDTKSHEA